MFPFLCFTRCISRSDEDGDNRDEAKATWELGKIIDLYADEKEEVLQALSKVRKQKKRVTKTSKRKSGGRGWKDE